MLGKYCTQFEDEIARRHGVKYGVAVNSGTDALRIALQAARIGEGDEVITSAFTFVASVEVIAQLGAVPVFVDIEADTFHMNPSLIEAAITPRTKAIMPIHLFGQLAAAKQIKQIADQNGLTVIEDSAQALDNHCDGVYTGKFGLAAGFSFYVTKNLGAAGDGGLILTDDEEIRDKSLSLRIHGMGKERYYYDDLGYTSRMAEIQAAVLCAKLEKLDGWNARRAELAQVYIDGLEGTDVETPVTSAGNNHTYHQFAIRCDSRGELMKHLQESEVSCSIFYPVPLHLHAPYRAFGGGEGSLPVTERVSKQVLSLPINPHLSEEQVRFVCQSIQRFCARCITAR